MRDLAQRCFTSVFPKLAAQLSHKLSIVLEHKQQSQRHKDSAAISTLLFAMTLLALYTLLY
jgi:hypothetical protein